MKHTTCGKSHNRNWYGLNFITKVPMSWVVEVETLGWEVWKLTVTTSNGVTTSKVLKKTGDNPSVFIKKLFQKNCWRTITCDLIIEDYVGE